MFASDFRRANDDDREEDTIDEATESDLAMVDADDDAVDGWLVEICDEDNSMNSSRLNVRNNEYWGSICRAKISNVKY